MPALSRDWNSTSHGSKLSSWTAVSTDARAKSGLKPCLAYHCERCVLASQPMPALSRDWNPTQTHQRLTAPEVSTDARAKSGLKLYPRLFVIWRTDYVSTDARAKSGLKLPDAISFTCAAPVSTDARAKSGLKLILSPCLRSRMASLNRCPR